MNEFGQNDPKLWKLGLFYFNPKDPEILSPRSGVGRQGPAINFGHKRTYLYIVLFFAAIIVAGYLKDNF